MKKLKKIALALVCVMMIGVLGGCGVKFDAQAYLNALLDASYKNDSTAFVNMKIGTAEEAAELYEQGIDSEMDAFLSQLEVSEELEAEFRQLFKDMLGKVKYTVEGAQKQEDGSYIVTVSYEQMIIFEPIMADYEAVITDLTTQWMESEEVPSEDEMMEAMIVALKDCMQSNLENVEYAEAETTEVAIELVDKVYTPNQDDVANLESVLFDTEAAN